MENFRLSDRDTAQLSAAIMAMAGLSSCIDHAVASEPVVPQQVPVICSEVFARTEQLLRGTDRCSVEIYEMPVPLNNCRNRDPERVRQLIEAIDFRTRECLEPQRGPAIQMTRAHASRSHRPQNRKVM